MDPSDPLSLHARWLRQIGPRLGTLWLTKMVGTAVGMTVFFVVYFQLLRHPLFPVTVVPLLGLDRLIGFQPKALSLYLSLWIYVSLAPALLLTRRELISYAKAATVLSLIGFAIFLFWPTAVPPASIDWSRHPSLAFLKATDAGGNACPSLHVAFGVFTAIWFERLLRQMGAGGLARTLNWGWFLGIAYSTLAIRQHVALDALAGAVLGAMVGGIQSLRSGTADKPRPSIP